jgi:hypothetical protein
MTDTDFAKLLADNPELSIYAPVSSTPTVQTVMPDPPQPQRTQTLKLIIPIRSASINQIYSASHWNKRNKLAAQVHEQVRWQLQIDEVPKVFFAPRVDISIDAYFHGKMLDSSNIPAKLFEDGLKSWVLADDDPRFVRRITTQSHLSETGRESVVITVKHIGA